MQVSIHVIALVNLYQKKGSSADSNMIKLKLKPHAPFFYRSGNCYVGEFLRYTGLRFLEPSNHAVYISCAFYVNNEWLMQVEMSVIEN